MNLYRVSLHLNYEEPLVCSVKASSPRVAASKAMYHLFRGPPTARRELGPDRQLLPGEVITLDIYRVVP